MEQSSIKSENKIKSAFQSSLKNDDLLHTKITNFGEMRMLSICMKDSSGRSSGSYAFHFPKNEEGIKKAVTSHESTSRFTNVICD